MSNSKTNDPSTVDDIECFNRHENHSTSFLNPIRNCNFSSENFTVNSGFVNFISLIFSIIIIYMVVHAMYLTFDWNVFWFSLFITFCIFIIRPNILDSLIKTPALQYFSLVITFSLVMAIEKFRNSEEYRSLIILNMLVSVISFLTQIRGIIAIGIYMNIYVLSLIAFSNMEQTSVQ